MYVCINTHRKKLSSRTRERESFREKVGTVFFRATSAWRTTRGKEQTGNSGRTAGIARRRRRLGEREREYI
jgi:hypothetical protein